MWSKAGAKVKTRDAVQKTVASTLLGAYKTVKKTPDDFYRALLENNTTHFTPDELERLLAAFKRVTHDRLQASHFYEIVEVEMGWSNLLLRKQLFKAFDFDGHGDINFTEFAEGYSTLLRGTVPEMLEFAWRVYHIQGAPDLLALTDMYTTLRLALAGLEEVRKMQGPAAGGSTEDTRFPERTARQILEHILGDRQAPLTKEEFNHMVLKHRRLVDCLMPGFELIPQDPLHRAAESGEAAEVQHLLEVDLLEVDGRDALSYPSTPLHGATRYGHPDVVAILLNKGANMRLQSEEGETALSMAVHYGRQRIVELLIEAGCDVVMPNKDGATAFHSAAYHGQVKALRTLMPYLEKNITQLKDVNGYTPLHKCAMADNWMVIDMFLEYDKLRLTDLEVIDNQGQTALHTAVAHKSFRVTRKLIELGADVGAVDYSGKSVLNVAVRVKENEAVLNLLLLNDRCDVDLTDDNGVSPLKACIPTEDIKMVRALLAHHADANLVEHGTGSSPLHQSVLQKWLEGVDALLAPGVEAKIMRDAAGLTPFDYARTQEIFDLLRDHVENLYPVWTPDHPVDFIFGIVFKEGDWKLETEGDLIGMRVLQRPKVSKAVAAKRMEHKMIDKNSMKRQLRKAGLVVLEEQVRVQEKILGVINTSITQYALLRVGVPLYRLQQEAMKMRVQVQRTDFNRREDFYVDEENYPDTGFKGFTLGEKQKVLLNIIQSTPTNESLLAGGPAAKLAKQPYVAGISISHYKKYQVIHDFTVLHEPRMRGKVMELWSVRSVFTKRYWRTQLLDYFSESKNNEFMSLRIVMEYFGHKMSFYFGYLSFYTNWLIAPAIAGIITFCLEWIPSEYDSEIKDTPEDSEKFDDQYDHPLMFIYAFFIAVWLALIVQGWATKSKELSFRWGVEDDLEMDRHTPNPFSTAPVRLQFVRGAWQYRAVLTSEQKFSRIRVMLLVSIPCLLFFIGLVVAYTFAVGLLDDLIDKNNDLVHNKGLADEKLNEYGRMANYASMGLQALIIVILNNVYSSVAIWTCNLENHESIMSYEVNLAVRCVLFQLINNYSSLFYYAYYARSIDKTGMMVGSLMIIGQILGQTTEYLIPYLAGKEPTTVRMEKKRAREAKKIRQKEEQAKKKAALSGGDIVLMDETKTNLLGGEPAGASAADQSAMADVYGNNKPIVDINLPQESVAETFSEARDEVLNPNQSNVLEMCEIAVQFGYVAMFGATWPLAALVAFINNFFETRLDMWKFCTLSRRPMAERVSGLGPFWVGLMEATAVLGITNHMFLLGWTSNTMDEYFFPGITDWKRLFAAFVAQNFFLMVYMCVRLLYADRVPDWVMLKKKEPLRFIRDAYRAGCALRERRYRMLLLSPHTPMKLVCRAEDIDEGAADRYLQLTRYIDNREEEEKKALLYDSSTTIQALLTTVQLKARGKVWADEGERPTAAGLLRELVPVTDIRTCYIMGKKLREAAYHIWETHKDVTVMGSAAATIMSIRQFGCIEVGCTMPQAERYCRLVRYVEQAGLNPWERLVELNDQFPRGLMQVLSSTAEEGALDSGEPPPAELGDLIEPIGLAKRAFEKADIVRRKMYERWVHDKDMQHDELVQSVCEETGAFPAQLERYLLIKRYCDGLEERKRKDVLQFATSRTLLLCATIQAVIRDGGWRDPGEPSFYTYTPPIVVEEGTAE